MVVKTLAMAGEELLLIVARYARQTELKNLLECLEIECWKPIGSDYCKLIAGDEQVGEIGPRDVFVGTVRDRFQKPVHPRFRSAYSALPELDHSPA